LRDSQTTLSRPLRSEERISRCRPDQTFHQGSGSVTSVLTLRRASRHHMAAPLTQHRSPVPSHLPGSEEPFQSLASRSRSSEVNERAFRLIRISEELRTPLPARPSAQLGLSCRPLLASSPNSPQPNMRSVIISGNTRMNLRRSSHSEECFESRWFNLLFPASTAHQFRGIVSTSRRTLRRLETSRMSRARRRPPGPPRRSEEHLSRSHDHLLAP
jgi:hypothetical protein